MPVTTQPSQQRSRERREALLDAALALFAEGGSRAVTSRAVATRAGLPPASTVYYFPTVDGLLHDALERHLRGWLELLASLTAVDDARARSPHEPAPPSLGDDAARLVERALGGRSASHSGTDLRIFLAGAQEPGLRDLAARALTAFDALLTGLLTRAGAPRPDEAAATAVTLLLGTAVRRQAAGDLEADRREVTRVADQVRRLVDGTVG